MLIVQQQQQQQQSILKAYVLQSTQEALEQSINKCHYICLTVPRVY